jgi:hypothetical protein
VLVKRGQGATADINKLRIHEQQMLGKGSGASAASVKDQGFKRLKTRTGTTAERIVRNDEVTGSIPVRSTKTNHLQNAKTQILSHLSQ